MEVWIRQAVEADLERINEIYNAYIVDSHVSFDLDPWTIEKRRRWWEQRGEYPALVVGTGDDVVGVAYASPYKDKAGYASSVETTVVLDPEVTGRKIGGLLLSKLLDEVAASGAHRAYAIVALPNDASIKVHHRLGFETIGVLDEVGHKLGQYWSTMILQKRFEAAEPARDGA